MIVRACAVAAAVLLILVAAFQVALVLGAPWGEYTQGGGTQGALPAWGRMLALVSGVLLVAMASVVLARAGVRPLKRVPPRVIGVLSWLTLAYAVAAVALNIVTQSAVERLVFAPTSIVLLVCIGVVVLGTRQSQSGTA